MTDPQLERRLRAWYIAEVDDDHAAPPPELREARPARSRHPGLEVQVLLEARGQTLDIKPR